MKQVVQNIRNGKLTVEAVPDPVARPGQVLIANAASVISAGTERAAMELARKSLIGKARARPDHVRRVIEKIRNEGFFRTLAQVREKLDEPMAMGYSSSGVVLACGAGVQEYKPGDRVASNGPHAGIVSVPRLLSARVPDGVPHERAAFAVLGAIAMQGVRLSRTALGETAFVIGLGLIGQIAVALLKAAGVRVIGTDPDAPRCELALRMGAAAARPDLAADDVASLTRSLGADAVLITASTDSSGPVELAGEAVRQKGRVVAVGAVGLTLPRRPYYFKEAELVVSCSYGPGRYDADYEERGRDYPAAYVRWTEQRNMQAVLDMMAAGALDVAPLISHRFGIEEAERAYALIDSGSEPYLGMVLEYPEVDPERPERRIELRGAARARKGAVSACLLGAGNYARLELIPAMKKAGLRLRGICSAGGLSAVNAGEKHGFEAAFTDEDDCVADGDTEALFVATPHDQHARQVLKILTAGKHVFCEKPLALTLEQLAEIEAALEHAAGGEGGVPILTVGFNRRFSLAAGLARKHFAGVTEPLAVTVRFNAGDVPADHWTQDEAVGGGRIIGEACHGIDLAAFLAGSPPVRVFAESVGGPGAPGITDDRVIITMRHANGAVSSVAYLAGGDKSFPKERIEVIGGGRVAVIDDFDRLTTVAGGKSRTRSTGRDKGHAGAIAAFAGAVASGGPAPIPWEELRSVTLAAILAVRSLREGVAFEVA